VVVAKKENHKERNVENLVEKQKNAAEDLAEDSSLFLVLFYYL
jgi:hypothetical protein